MFFPASASNFLAFLILLPSLVKYYVHPVLCGLYEPGITSGSSGSIYSNKLRSLKTVWRFLGIARHPCDVHLQLQLASICTCPYFCLSESDISSLKFRSACNCTHRHREEACFEVLIIFRIKLARPIARPVVIFMISEVARNKNVSTMFLQKITLRRH